MKPLEIPTNENVLVGLGTGDDSGVYKISDDCALVQTVDFITPLTDDPFKFGQIAASNSLSDVFAMGGKVLTAMNILSIPCKKIGMEVVGEILAGGADKIRESGGVLIGGHTIENPELVYGLSVTGSVHPDKVYANSGAKPGDLLVLTKPLGSGLVNSLVKFGKASAEEEAHVIESMISLNMKSAGLLEKFNANAVTDVTGFGLVGHSSGMALQSRVNLIFDFSRLPLLKGANRAAESKKLVPAGTYRNFENYKSRLILPEVNREIIKLIVCDPQTSGGLLVSLPEKSANEYVSALLSEGIAATIVGEVSEGDGKVIVR